MQSRACVKESRIGGGLVFIPLSGASLRQSEQSKLLELGLPSSFSVVWTCYNHAIWLFPVFQRFGSSQTRKSTVVRKARVYSSRITMTRGATTRTTVQYIDPQEAQVLAISQT